VRNTKKKKKNPLLFYIQISFFFFSFGRNAVVFIGLGMANLKTAIEQPLSWGDEYFAQLVDWFRAMNSGRPYGYSR
jgi:hypothetical protein